MPEPPAQRSTKRRPETRSACDMFSSRLDPTSVGTLPAPHQTAHIVMTIWTRMTVTSRGGPPGRLRRQVSIEKLGDIGEIETDNDYKQRATAAENPPAHKAVCQFHQKRAGGVPADRTGTFRISARRRTVPTRCRRCASGDRGESKAAGYEEMTPVRILSRAIMSQSPRQRAKLAPIECRTL
jgi:hypothetical protein